MTRCWWPSRQRRALQERISLRRGADHPGTGACRAGQGAQARAGIAPAPRASRRLAHDLEDIVHLEAQSASTSPPPNSNRRATELAGSTRTPRRRHRGAARARTRRARRPRARTIGRAGEAGSGFSRRIVRGRSSRTSRATNGLAGEAARTHHRRARRACRRARRHRRPPQRRSTARALAAWSPREPPRSPPAAMRSPMPPRRSSGSRSCACAPSTGRTRLALPPA